MAVHIRLSRGGAKKTPFYRVVITDQRSPRDGRFLETVGTYDPSKNPAAFVVDQARIDYWRGQGAQPTATVERLLKRHSATAQAAGKAS